MANIAVVTSGKGGVGKTTSTPRLALRWRRLDRLPSSWILTSACAILTW